LANVLAVTLNPVRILNEAVIPRLRWTAGGQLVEAVLERARAAAQAHTAAIRIARTDRASINDAPRGRMGVPGLIDLGLDGFLWPEEAGALYDLALRAPGDILELGTYHGLSSLIMSTALSDRGHGEIHTCDLSREFSLFARRALRWHKGRRRIRFHVDDGTRFLDRNISAGRTFGLIFVDHNHEYEPTREAAVRIPALLRVGGLAVFHDYADPANLITVHPDKVRPAVDETLGADGRFALDRIVGSAAVFRRER
jgi:predicted O-methyltransferase YrrM